ncbi:MULTISPECIES: TRAP transporter substrate-binding protein [unclassified Roseateles]|uniref:TRAP transporter substrate-binding protein n=1 Tax=unclassified Roseateles TaxID=2626991 RepID=UPI000700CF66|nr:MULTISPECIES: TRAP transporter substrate-binding protein [unclassified Roseateles]KQW52194.1 C4-dicarboxylate ABC transporter [Pelomonas sp. Root405]KRA78428.1 C4-dicarboxylate ABC transporter [Pelomonas sp. Root662]
MKNHLTLLSAALLGSSAFALELKSADVHNSDDYPTVAAVKHLGQVLAKSSGGALTVKVFNKGALGSEKETIDQVKIGALAMTRVNLGPLSSMCPKTLVPALPFLFRDTAHMRKAYDGAPGAEILKSCEHQGLVGLALYDSGARSVYARKPIKTLADMKGLKIRVQQTDLWVAAMTALGANPSPMPIGEVYTGLKTSLIDAAENNIPSYEGFRHFEAAKFYSRTEHSMTPDALFISKRVWDKLKPEQQAQLREAAKASVAVQRERWDAQEAKALAIVKAAGSEIVETDREAFRKAVQPVNAKFVSTPELQALVKAIQDIK